MRSFASDNNAGVSPEILNAIIKANEDHEVAYGADPYTERAQKKFKEHFGEDAEAFFVFNGTAANVLSIKSLIQSYHAVLCAESAHINNDECGAPEGMTGSKLISIPTHQGKLTPDLIEVHLQGVGDQHHVQPKMISITQSTELGTVYTPSEISALSKIAVKHKLFLHMDGARISNAAANLACTFKEITTDVGVDVLSFGGTKNGLLGGEAVVFLKKDLSRDFKFLRKQMMQLSSKMRFISTQFEALLTNDLWRTNALHANKMAKLLALEVGKVDGVRVLQPVQANGVFAQIPKAMVAKLQSKFFFYVLNGQHAEHAEVRWMTSFNTTTHDVQTFVDVLKSL